MGASILTHGLFHHSHPAWRAKLSPPHPAMRPVTGLRTSPEPPPVPTATSACAPTTAIDFSFAAASGSCSPSFFSSTIDCSSACCPGGGSARRASHAPPTPSSVVSIDPARRSDPPDPCSRPAIYRLALSRFPSVPPVLRNKRFTQNSKHPP